MLPANPWEHHAPMKALYSACMEPVCKKHHVTRTELDILLFLSNNPQYDTASDIVEVRYLVKSHVSTSVRALERAGFLEKLQLLGDRRSARLRVLPAAESLVADGREAQERFVSILLEGLDREELHTLERCFDKISKNMKTYLEGTQPC